MHYLALILQQGPNPVAIRHAVMALMAIMPIVILFFLTIVVVPFWFICKKAGFSPWLSLLNVVPLGNIALIYVLAFADWKVVPAPPAYWPPQSPYPPQTIPPQG